MENDLSYLRHSQNRDFCPLKRGSGGNSTRSPLFEGIEGELESAVKKILRGDPECWPIFHIFRIQNWKNKI